jgi:cytochrome c biogenesis factor
MRGIGNIVFGLVFIVGGLSGKLVFIGTNSGELLAAVGVGLLIFGIAQMSKSGDEAPERPRVKAGDQAVVNQEAVAYTEMDSRSAPVTTLASGSKVQIVEVTESKDVVWLRIALPDGQQGYIPEYKVR